MGSRDPYLPTAKQLIQFLGLGGEPKYEWLGLAQDSSRDIQGVSTPNQNGLGRLPDQGRSDP